MKNIYLERHAATGKLIEEEPDKQLGIIVTIPAYNEEKLDQALMSLSQCALPSCSVEVIVLINFPENSDADVIEKSRRQYEDITKLVNSLQKPGFSFFILSEPLPKKHAGVGMARKIIMDEAVRRFNKINKPQGIIAAFDADCSCESNYLIALESFFQLHPKANGCSIYFEHHKEDEYGENAYKAVYEYELHLRCYIDALRWCKIPHAFQTIGSSMAVNHKIYQQQGGMNRRKAGEDFYFLHKIIPLGEFGDLTETMIIPSIRPSERVPFGTGKAVNKWLELKKQYTYHSESYPPLKKLVEAVPDLYKKNDPGKLVDQFSDPLKDFLIKHDFIQQVQRINAHSTTHELFLKHFYQWLNGFMVMKYLHHVRDNYYPMIPVAEAASQIKGLMSYGKNNEDLLSWYRAYDRQHPIYKHSV